jgi:DNA-binding response OmpR family regulator
MRVLIADDDAVVRHAVRAYLTRWEYDIVECRDGHEAWDAMQQTGAPSLAILDWNMPGRDGVTLCQDLRKVATLSGMYLILLTSNHDKKDVIAGLESGADDYITKPVDWDQLQARLRIGTRIVGLQRTLAARVCELEEAIANVRTLSGLLPICAYCKRVRDDHDYWKQIEHYLAEHSDAMFSHGICPECLEEQLPAAG